MENSRAVPNVIFLLGRVLFGVVVGFFSFWNLRYFESSVGNTDSKSVPLASLTALLANLGLITGVLGVLVGFYPTVGVLAIVAFLGLFTVIMHDFRTSEGWDKHNRQNQVLKNVGFTGAGF